MNMKRLSLLLLICIVSILGLNARTFVLITGVSNYGNEQNNLGQSTKDAKRFKELMLTQTKDITLLTSSNVTRANVLEKLRAICNRAQAGDRVIFFYSGHGTPGAICGYDANITYNDLMNVMSTSAAKEKMCFIDACFAGTITGAATESSGTDDIRSKPGQAIFISSRPTEISRESPILGAGFFTQALLKGLRGKADKDANKQITVLELFKYIYGDVVKRSKGAQHPQLIAPKDMYNAVVGKW
ncbi:MAG: caspase family protein [Bacteroidales bacterium]|nr:caspase family protein [Bacteroidales bacterium]